MSNKYKFTDAVFLGCQKAFCETSTIKDGVAEAGTYKQNAALLRFTCPFCSESHLERVVSISTDREIIKPRKGRVLDRREQK